MGSACPQNARDPRRARPPGGARWLLCLLALAPLLTARADEPPADGPGAGEAEAEVATVRGHDVNLRAGPRVDGHAITQLDPGTVLVVVDRVPGWVAVRVPRGFAVAAALEHLERLAPEAVRVKARRLNLRAGLPEEGRPLPPALRDPVPQGTRLALLDVHGDWALVMAPEDAIVYVHEDYLEVHGPLAEHRARVDAARAERARTLETLAALRREAAARATAEALRRAIGAAQQALWRLRQEAGWEQAPVVEISNRLEAALAAAPAAPVGVQRLAAALCRDLEGELALRVARRDAELARLRGLAPAPEPAPARPPEPLTARGTVRWEAAEGWRNRGAFVLWQGEEPRFVLELTVGLAPPIPDLAAADDGREHAVVGTPNGERVFGLPVLVVSRLD